MADANAIAAAVTTALAAHTSNRETGPRDPKYSELDIEPETRSPDLLDRSSFRAYYRQFRVKFFMTMMTYGILPYIQAAAYHHTSDIKLNDYDGVGAWTGDNNIGENDAELKKCENRAYFYLFHVLAPSGHWAAIRDKVRNDKMPMLHFFMRLDEHYLKSTNNSKNKARTELYSNVTWKPRETLSSFYLQLDQAVTNFEYETRYCDTDPAADFTVTPQELFFIIKDALLRKSDAMEGIIENFETEVRLHHGNKLEPPPTGNGFTLLEQLKDKCLEKEEKFRSNGVIPQAMYAAIPTAPYHSAPPAAYQAQPVANYEHTPTTQVRQRRQQAPSAASAAPAPSPAPDTNAKST